MTLSYKKAFGWILILSGALIVVFSHQIVFPGLERLIGIGTIVGKDNVIYEPDGSYEYTNPSAMAHWIAAVAALGFLVFLFGVWILARSKKGGVKSK